jgi:hypothetical protein
MQVNTRQSTCRTKIFIVEFIDDISFSFVFVLQRLCKEPNHIPLRCDEVEKGVELEMRKFIEEHVSEAMIRKCPRCTQVSRYQLKRCARLCSILCCV